MASLALAEAQCSPSFGFGGESADYSTLCVDISHGAILDQFLWLYGGVVELKQAGSYDELALCFTYEVVLQLRAQDVL